MTGTPALLPSYSIPLVLPIKGEEVILDRKYWRSWKKRADPCLKLRKRFVRTMIRVAYVIDTGVKIMFGIKNDVVQIPGQPCMYDYEHQPQEVRCSTLKIRKKILTPRIQMIFPPVAGALWMEAQG